MSAGSASAVMIQLQNRELWERFKEAGTEMVITKQGRCMFPVIRLNFSGLEPNCYYALVMDFVIAKESKRKFLHASASWTAAMPADFSPIEGSYVHPGTPAKGLELMDSTTSFHKLKLSNRFHASSQVVTLKSMHAYIPRLHVYEIPYGYQGEWHHVTSFVLHQAEFVAVTSYNNKMVCKLKIDNNPFAKAFRKAGLSSAKRQRLEASKPVSGTSYTGTTERFSWSNRKFSPLDQSECEESLTSGYRAGLEHIVVTDSGFPSGNLSFNGINSLESFCSELYIEIGSRRTHEDQTSTEGGLTEKRDSEELEDSAEGPAPLNLSRRRRRKATPRRIRRAECSQTEPGQEATSSDCQTTPSMESPEIRIKKAEEDHVDHQLQEVEGTSKIQDASEGEFQKVNNAVQEEFQENQNTPEEQIQEMQSVPDEPPQEIQETSSEETKEFQEKSDLCDVMWLTSLGSKMNVDDGNSLKSPNSGLNILEPTTARGDDSTRLGDPCQGPPYASQVSVTMTSKASCSLAGDVSECIAVQSPVMEKSKSPKALHVTSSNVHVTVEGTEANQSDVDSLGHVVPAPVGNSASMEPPTSCAAQEGKEARDAYFSFADVLRNTAVTGLTRNCRNISERDAVMSTWNTQASFPGHGVSAQSADHVTQTQTPAEMHRSLPSQFDPSVSNSWPVIVSVYSQKSCETGREPNVRPLNVTPIETTTAIPISHESSRSLTEIIANAPQWSSSAKPLPTANEGIRNLTKVITSQAPESTHPVVLNSYSLQNQTGQQQNSNGTVFQKGIARIQMPWQPYGRDVLNLDRRKAGVLDLNSSHKSARFPVALQAFYSFCVPRPEEATVQRPYLCNRYYKPTRTIFSRFSLEPRCSVLPCTSARYGWREVERTCPYCT